MGAHAVMPAARPSSGCGVLSWFVPPALAGEVAREAAAERDAVLAAAGEKVPRRRARLLPPWLAVYFTLALCLLARLPYQDVLRSLAGDGATGLAVPATTALTAARRRLGERPLELLFQRVAGVLPAVPRPVGDGGRAARGGLGRDHPQGPGQPGEHRRVRPATAAGGRLPPPGRTGRHRPWRGTTRRCGSSP